METEATKPPLCKDCAHFEPSSGSYRFSLATCAISEVKDGMAQVCGEKQHCSHCREFGKCGRGGKNFTPRPKSLLARIFG